jgi:hypothetical protein
MSFLDRLLGTSKPVAVKTEALFAMTTAVITLQTSLHLEPSNEAALCFKAIEMTRFEDLKTEIDGLLKIRAADTNAPSMNTMIDQYGYQWVILKTEQFEDLVTTLHLVSEELKGGGFGEQLLSAVFKFTGEGRNVYWIYNYKRGTFYPMVPSGNQTRDNAFELRLKTLMDREMPIEKELERWYPLWGSPV